MSSRGEARRRGRLGRFRNTCTTSTAAAPGAQRRERVDQPLRGYWRCDDRGRSAPRRAGRSCSRRPAPAAARGRARRARRSPARRRRARTRTRSSRRTPVGRAEPPAQLGWANALDHRRDLARPRRALGRPRTAAAATASAARPPRPPEVEPLEQRVDSVPRSVGAQRAAPRRRTRRPSASRAPAPPAPARRSTGSRSARTRPSAE